MDSTKVIVILVISALLIGCTVVSVNIIKESRLKGHIKELETVLEGVELFVLRTGRLPGDLNGDGRIDDNQAAWDELERHRDSHHIFSIRDPGRFQFGHGYCQGCRGNYVFLKLPVEVAEYIDAELDDGRYDWGQIRTYEDYRLSEETSTLFALLECPGE
jgi:hypothetical protein